MRPRRSSLPRSTALLGICLTATACLPSWLGGGNDVVAEVGGEKILRREAELRDEVTHIYYPADKRRLGLPLLIRSYTDAQILRNHGRAITPEVIEREEKRIDEGTQLPEVLEKIKKAFGNDKTSYRRVLVLPTYVDRVIYFDFFLRDPKIQKNSIEVAQRFLERAKTHRGSFKDLAEKWGARSMPLTITPKDGIRFENPDPDLRKIEGVPPREIPGSGDNRDALKKAQDALDTVRLGEARRLLEAVISQLKPGQVFPKVIDRQESWLVLRYTGHNGLTYKFEGVPFQKANYAEWLKAERAKIPVVIHDPSLMADVPKSRK